MVQFLDSLVNKTESGGEEAAQLLQNAVTNYIKEELSDLQTDLDVVVRVYTNIKGLSKLYVDNNVLGERQELDRFVCGFNKKYRLFDFVDAGDGKECSDVKLQSRALYFPP